MAHFVIKIYRVNHRGKVRDLCKDMKRMIDRRKKFLVFQLGSHDHMLVT